MQQVKTHEIKSNGNKHCLFLSLINMLHDGFYAIDTSSINDRAGIVAEYMTFLFAFDARNKPVIGR